MVILKKILFKGLSPYGTHTHNGRQYANGDILECEDAVADALIDAHLAIDTNDREIDAQKLKEQIEKDNKTREKVLKKGGKK